MIRAVVTYIRALPKTDDFDQLGMDMFGSEKDPRVKRLKASVQYYVACTQEGYHKPKAKKPKKKVAPIKIAALSDEAKKTSSASSAAEKTKKTKKDSHSELVERIALDLDHLELSEAISAATKAMDEEEQQNVNRVGPGGDSAPNSSNDQQEDREETESPEPIVTEETPGPLSVLQALASGVEVKPSEDGRYPNKDGKGAKIVRPIRIPDAHPEVYKTALERHRQAQMSPYVYQLLTRGEIKLPVLLEEAKANGAPGMPPIHLVYRQLRQSVYGVIFNLHHLKFNRKQVDDAVKSNRRKAEDLKKQAKVSYVYNTELFNGC